VIVAGYHPDGLAAAKVRAISGCCVFCEEPLHGKRRVICGSPDCERAMNSAYVRDRRRGARRVRRIRAAPDARS
jgi:hypothetical protein